MKKRIKSIYIQWVLPIIVLIIVMVATTFDFYYKSERSANNTVTKNIITMAESCARTFNDEITLPEKVGKPIAKILSKSMENKTLDQDLSYEVELLEIAVSDSGAYMAYICDDNGKVVSNDGKKSSIADMDYYRELPKRAGIGYSYTLDDGEGQDAVIVSVPIMSEAENRLDLLLFYSLNNLSQRVKRSDFNIWNIEALVDSNGDIIASYGNYGYWRQGDNLFDALNNKYPDFAAHIKTIITSKKSTMESIDEYNALVYTSLGAGEWSVIFGVPQSYISRQVEQQWIVSRNMLNRLMLVFGIFILFILIVSIGIRIYNNKKQKQLESKADTDLLTGLNNKLATERKIKEFIEKHPDAQSMMFVFDIDNFKKINDTMGHAFGDEVLRSLGQQIRVLFRASDIVGRAGGDEFIVFLKNITEPEIVRKEAKKVEDFFKDFKAGEYTKYSATASIGVAIFPQEGADFESLYKAADSALYKAKQRGKKQLAFYNDKWI